MFFLESGEDDDKKKNESHTQEAACWSPCRGERTSDSSPG